MDSNGVRTVLRPIWHRMRPYAPSWLLPAVYFALGYPSYLRSLIGGRGPTVRRKWLGDGDVAAADRVAIFAHYDAAGLVHGWLLKYLIEIRRAGYEIIFLSNAPQIDAEAVEKVRPYCALVVHRNNVGYDFGAYRDGIRLIPDLGRVDSLLLANDSVYGPFHPLSASLDRMYAEVAPVWSMTDSMEGRFHLQSYFLLFHRAAIAHPAFTRFWREHRDVKGRYWTIVKCELGLTHAMMRAGLQCRAFCSSSQAAAIADDRQSGCDAPGVPGSHCGSTTRSRNRIVAKNPMHAYWDVLIRDLNCPFVKRDLLRTNPAGDPDLGRWRSVVERVSDYDTGLIPDLPKAK